MLTQQERQSMELGGDTACTPWRGVQRAVCTASACDRIEPCHERLLVTTHAFLVNILRRYRAFQMSVDPSRGFLRYHGALSQAFHDT